MGSKQQVNFRIDKDLLEALKLQAKAEGISYTDLIQKFCSQGLNGGFAGNTIQFSDSTIQHDTIQSDNNDIQSTIQPDILKEQLKAELWEGLSASINELFKANMEPIKEEKQALLGK